jgi:chromosome segregation ATPase
MKINPVVGVIFGVLLMVSMPSFGKGGSNVIEIAEVDHELEQLGGEFKKVRGEMLKHIKQLTEGLAKIQKLEVRLAKLHSRQAEENHSLKDAQKEKATATRNIFQQRMRSWLKIE